MNIAINAKAAFEPYRTGIEEYAYQLLRQWAVHAPRHLKLLFYTNRFPDRGVTTGQTLEGFLGTALPENIRFEAIRLPYLWSQLRLGVALLKDRPDVFFNPAQLLPLYAPPRSVVTVHDLGFEHFPETHSQFSFRYLRWVTRRAVRAAAAVIAVSENTKNDLISIYGVPADKIAVIYHGFTLPETDQMLSRGLDHVVVDEFKNVLPFDTRLPFFLFLGRLELKKNLINLIRAFEILKLRHRLPHNLVLAGYPYFGYQAIKEAIESSPVRDSIFEVGHVAGAVKLRVLRAARVLVHVSFYEGFGLPILEAQSLGVPVVAAATSSLPEIGGKGAIFVNPGDPEAIAEGMYKVTMYPQLRNYYIQNGFKNARRFSWAESARQTMGLLEEVGRRRVYF